MARPKRKLTRTEKVARAARRAAFMTIFVNGKQKRVRRQPIIDGINQEEFIERNADPIWLHQNEMWEHINPEPPEDEPCDSVPDVPPSHDETPF